MSGEPARSSADGARATTCSVEAVDGESVVRVEGDLDISTLAVLARALAEAMSATDGVLLVDLAACRFLCSRSFAMLETAAEGLSGSGGELVVRGWPASFDLIRGVVGAGSPLAAAA